MKVILPVFLLVIFAVSVFGQTKKLKLKTNSNLQTLVETEKAFAKAAELKGTKAAFLEFLADDGIVFQPTETNGKLYWQNRPESSSWLEWSPAWADISSDGNIGYTTGGWSFHPKGKTDAAVAFGEYFTIWKKQPDGKFKAVLDLGVSHEKPLKPATNWTSPTDAGSGTLKSANKVSLDYLTDIFSKELLSQGYFNHFADDVVILREGFEPFYGKTNAFLALEKMNNDFPKKSFLNFNADMSPVFGNMMYSKGTYQLTHKDKTVSRWNFAQVWKNRNGKWQLVADVFTPVKEK